MISYLLICIGIALSNRCGLPIIPTDLFPRELSEIIKVKYSKIKVSFDVICLMITACMTGLILGAYQRTGNRNSDGGIYHGKSNWIDW